MDPRSARHQRLPSAWATHGGVLRVQQQRARAALPANLKETHQLLRSHQPSGALRRDAALGVRALPSQSERPVRSDTSDESERPVRLDSAGSSTVESCQTVRETAGISWKEQSRSGATSVLLVLRTSTADHHCRIVIQKEESVDRRVDTSCSSIWGSSPRHARDTPDP